MERTIEKLKTVVELSRSFKEHANNEAERLREEIMIKAATIERLKSSVCLSCSQKIQGVEE